MRLFLKYLVSTDHKVIGLLYAFTSLFFLLVGFAPVIVIRWQLAYPGEAREEGVAEADTITKARH